MAKGLIGKKLGMTQIFDQEGNAVPVTVIEAGPNVVVQKRSKDRDGYAAAVVGFDEVKPRRLNKPERGVFETVGVEPRKVVKEVPVENDGEIEPGDEITADLFQPGDRVDVTGTSKGKGFTGAIKRHGFGRGPSSHGSHYHRGPGSHGASADPSRVFKGRKLPGRAGGETVTVQNLEVVRVDPERNLLLVKGSVPGAKKAYVTIKTSVKAVNG